MNEKSLLILLDLKTKLSTASEIRDGVDSFMTTNDYEPFLTNLLPEIFKLLETVPVSFSSTSMEQVSSLYVFTLTRFTNKAV